MKPGIHFNSEAKTSLTKFDFDLDVIRILLKNPTGCYQGAIGDCKYRMHIVSPHYVELICNHYNKVLSHELDFYHEQLKIPIVFPHFGLCMEFTEATELHLHKKDMLLPEPVKLLIKHFGVVIMQNVYLDTNVRDMGHRNRFPQLNFHVDRIPSQGSFYSVYTRNPFDDEQKYPRTSSTLFIPTLVAYLQSLKEGKEGLLNDKGLISNAVLFDSDSIKPLLNNIVVQHSWDQPTGTGEISIINNCNILHASYYPNILNMGYRIGVRYLG